MVRCILVFFAAAALGCGNKPTQPPLLVSAASDLQDALAEFGPKFAAAAGVKVQFNFAASGMLAQQIQAGAKVDVFASANVDFVDRLEKEGLILADTKCIYARGRLAAWSRENGPTVASLDDLVKPEVKRVAVANPATAPYGAAAIEALGNAGVWEKFKSKVVYGENVRQTLELARSGNVDAAIVSLSLTRSAGGKTYLIPSDLHQPIDQAAAVVKGTAHEAAARRFLEMLRGEEAKALLREHGFMIEAKD